MQPIRGYTPGLKYIFFQNQLYILLNLEKLTTMRADKWERRFYISEGTFLRTKDDGFVLRVA